MSLFLLLFFSFLLCDEELLIYLLQIVMRSLIPWNL